MSAETLRRAAALMRERAEAAEKVHASPWRPMGTKAVVYPMTKRMSGTVAETFPLGGSQEQADTTEHIASWHPAVALAVADWLDATAAENDSAEDSALGFLNFIGADAIAALAVARAYLGEATA